MPDKKSINIPSLLSKIDFSPDRAISASAESAALFAKAVELRRECMESRMNAEMDWERACAEKDLALRKQARALDEKITENGIKAEILLDKKVTGLLQVFNKSKAAEEYAKLLMKTFEMRADSANAICYATRKELDWQSSIEDGNRTLQKAREEAQSRFSEE